MLKLVLRFLTLTKDCYLVHILNVYNSLIFSVAELYIHTCMDTINLYIYIQTNRYVLSGKTVLDLWGFLKQKSDQI